MPKKTKRRSAKTPKGQIAINDREGMCQLRWRWEGKRLALSPGLPFDTSGFQLARAIADRIEHDMRLERLNPGGGHFDPSDLARYKPRKSEAPIERLSTVQLFTRWMEQSQRSQHTHHCRLKPLQSNLNRFGKDIAGEDSARAFTALLSSRQQPQTVNANLNLLKSFGAWAVDQGHWSANHFGGIPLSKTSKKRNRPFNRDEIQRLMNAASSDRTCAPYRDFIVALLHLGCRPSELIGLRWKHISVELRQVHICESLSRNPAGGARIRKSTKTGTDRYLDLSDRMTALFAGRLAESKPQPDGLVFLAPRGGPIDDHNFSRRVWKRLCQAAGVEYRPPYNARHSLISHLIEGGATLPQAASVAGHVNTRMVAQTYGHMVNRPTMPEF